ncbi:MAG: hypothetical protein V4690_04285 [Patescibacteria group bacterium]
MISGFSLIIQFLLSVITIALLAYGINKAKGEAKLTPQQWAGVFVPVLVVVAIHFGIYWVLREEWWLWAQQKGFMVSQLLLVLGFYASGLTAGGKAPKMLGNLAIVIGAVIFFSTIYSTARITMGYEKPKLSDLWAEKKADEEEGNKEVFLVYSNNWSSRKYPREGGITKAMGPVRVLYDNNEYIDIDEKFDGEWPEMSWFRIKSRRTDGKPVTIIRTW